MKKKKSEEAKPERPTLHKMYNQRTFSYNIQMLWLLNCVRSHIFPILPIRTKKATQSVLLQYS